MDTMHSSNKTFTLLCVFIIVYCTEINVFLCQETAFHPWQSEHGGIVSPCECSFSSDKWIQSPEYAELQRMMTNVDIVRMLCENTTFRIDHMEDGCHNLDFRLQQLEEDICLIQRSLKLPERTCKPRLQENPYKSVNNGTIKTIRFATFRPPTDVENQVNNLTDNSYWDYGNYSGNSSADGLTHRYIVEGDTEVEALRRRNLGYEAEIKLLVSKMDKIMDRSRKMSTKTRFQGTAVRVLKKKVELQNVTIMKLRQLVNYKFSVLFAQYSQLFKMMRTLGENVKSFQHKDMTSTVATSTENVEDDSFLDLLMKNSRHYP